MPDNAYDNVPYGWTYAPYSVAPSFCNLQKKCSSVTGPSNELPCQEIAADNTLSFQFSDQDYVDGLAPGTYTLTYEVTTSNYEPSLTETLQVQLTLIDLCDAATSIIKPTLVD